MLSEKPWKAEAVMLLGAGLFLSLALGSLSGLWLEHHLGKSGDGDRKFYNFVLSTVSFQGVALALIHLFLRQHSFGWRGFLGLGGPRLGRALALALGVGILAVPSMLVLNYWSAELISSFHVTPEEQSPIKVLKLSVGLGQRICFGVAAILVAPLVEEILFRGILYPAIKQRGRPQLALWGTSLLFAAIHANLMTFVPLTVLAIILVVLYERTDNLFAPILTHCFFNAANFFMYIYENELTDWLERLRERI